MSGMVKSIGEDEDESIPVARLRPHYPPSREQVMHQTELSDGVVCGGGVLYDTAIVTTLPGLDGDLEMFLLVYDVDIQQLMDEVDFLC